MKSKVCYPRVISQTSGGHFSKFRNLDNIKNDGSTFAESVIGMKTEVENRPSTISVTKFNLNLPSNAKIKSIVVEYAHYFSVAW